MTVSAAAPGLVICATTGREGKTEVDISVPSDPSWLLTRYAPRFPSSHDVDNATRNFLTLEAWDGHEGPRARVIVSPGAIAITRMDLARRERAAERARVRADHAASELAAYLLAHGRFPDEPESRRGVEGWSRRSRARMPRALCELDYSGLLTAAAVPGMVTLTYPGDWLTVAPDGAAVKRHLKAFLRRYRRAWGTALIGAWKLEVQGRGAPHLHILTVPPPGRSHNRAVAGGLPFRQWLSLTWASIVAHPDAAEYTPHPSAGTNVDLAEGLRHRDPKRIAVYFTKHGAFAAKEYQNVVPAPWREPGRGPGRFWGYWGLRRLTRGAELGPESAVWASRLLRRYARAHGTTRQILAPRTPGGRVVPVGWDVRGLAGVQLLAGERHTGTRRVRRRVQRMKHGAGWLSVNDGPAFAAAVARFLSTIIDPEGAPLGPAAAAPSGRAS